MSIAKIVSLVAALALFSNSAFAGCDWSTIVTNADGTYTYSKTLNLCVGNLVQSDVMKTQQVSDLNKAITLKDAAIGKSDARAQLWQDTALKLESNIQSIDSYKSTSNWAYFALGALTIIGAGVAAAQVHSLGR
jgi:hypothetical protein